MTVLLDTHVLLWALEDSARLSRTARDIIEDTSNTVPVSVVSAWKIELNRALGRLEAPEDPETALHDAGFSKRLGSFPDVRRLAGLPAHRRDPFERMIVAQVFEDGVPLVSADPLVARYSIELIW